MPRKPLEPEVLPADPLAHLPPEHAARVRRIRRVAQLMDEAVRIPGTNYKVGLDGLIGLVPVVGDLATSLVSAWILREAEQMGVPRSKLARMAANILLDMAVGSVPVIGDFIDVTFKANKKNVEILEQHFAAQHMQRKPPPANAPRVAPAGWARAVPR